MVSTKAFISAFGLGAALLAPSVYAQAPAPVIGRDSIARCSFTGTGLGGSMSAEVAVTVVETVTAYVCNSTEVNTAEANVTAQAVANATAFAIASVTAQCYANGRASFRLNGRSLVEAEAVAIASSVVSLVLEADACGTCNIATELFAEAYTEIVLQASALAQANLEGDSTRGTPAIAIANVLVTDIIEASVPAYASVLATVQAAVGQGCNATALFSVGDLGTDGGVCSIDITAANNSVAMNAVAEAIVDIEAMGCNDAIANSNINVTVEAIASAQAVALAQISASCVITGDASVCAFTTAEVNASAQATAEAFAFLYAAAISTCDPPVCEVDTAILTEAVSTVLTEASASAVLNQCSSPDSVFNVTVFEQEILESTLTALSTIIANVTVINGEECILDVPLIESIVTGTPGTPVVTTSPPVPPPSPPVTPPPPPPATTTPPPPPPVVTTPPPPPATPSPSLPDCFGTCVANNRRCAGSSTRFGDTPAQCCDPDYVCLRRNSRFSQCRRAVPTLRIPRGWDGVIEQCNPV